MITKEKIIVAVGALIAFDFIYAKFNSPILIPHENLPYNYNAQTTPPFGINIKKSELQNEKLISHELIHWQQYQKTGAIIFYLKYGLQKLIYGYDKMPLEVNARKAVGENEYCQKNYTECVRNGVALTINEKNFRL